MVPQCQEPTFIGIISPCWNPWKHPHSPMFFHYRSMQSSALPTWSCHTVYTDWHFARSVPPSEPPKTFVCPAPTRNPNAIPELFAWPHHTGLGRHIRAPRTNSSGNITLAINNQAVIGAIYSRISKVLIQVWDPRQIHIFSTSLASFIFGA